MRLVKDFKNNAGAALVLAASSFPAAAATVFSFDTTIIGQSTLLEDNLWPGNNGDTMTVTFTTNQTDFDLVDISGFNARQVTGNLTVTSGGITSDRGEWTATDLAPSGLDILSFDKNDLSNSVFAIVDADISSTAGINNIGDAWSFFAQNSNTSINACRESGVGGSFSQCSLETNFNPTVASLLAPVPVPAALPLLAGALGGLALVRRRPKVA